MNNKLKYLIAKGRLEPIIEHYPDGDYITGFKRKKGSRKHEEFQLIEKQKIIPEKK